MSGAAKNATHKEKPKTSAPSVRKYHARLSAVSDVAPDQIHNSSVQGSWEPLLLVLIGQLAAELDEVFAQVLTTLLLRILL